MNTTNIIATTVLGASAVVAVQNRIKKNNARKANALIIANTERKIDAAARAGAFVREKALMGDYSGLTLEDALVAMRVDFESYRTTYLK